MLADSNYYILIDFINDRLNKIPPLARRFIGPDRIIKVLDEVPDGLRKFTLDDLILALKRGIEKGDIHL